MAKVEEQKPKVNLSSVLESINKKYGTNTVFMMGSQPTLPVPSIPTGALTLDYAIGIGGIPRGRVLELYGSESSGKSTLALSIIAQCQQAGGIVAYVDCEHSITQEYCAQLGINVKDLIFTQPDYGEQALDIVTALVDTDLVDIIVFDSLAAAVPKAILEGSMEDVTIGLQARMFSKALSKLVGRLSKTKTTFLMINQLRTKIGTYGNPNTTTCGHAPKFYSSVRLSIRVLEQIKVKGKTDPIGNRVEVKVTKNKVAPPFKTAEFDIIFGKGVDTTSTLFDVAVSTGVITRAGSYYNYEDIRLGQGAPTAKLNLSVNLALSALIESEIKRRLSGGYQIDIKPTEEDVKEAEDSEVLSDEESGAENDTTESEEIKNEIQA